MNMTQKTICIIHHDKLTLPILDYLDKRSLVSLGMSGGVIVWVYKGLAMLIPPERVANIMRLVEAGDKMLNQKKVKSVKIEFTSADAIKLPSKIATALLGSNDGQG